MTDIVERLRQIGTNLSQGGQSIVILTEDAADEIERLRKTNERLAGALKQIADEEPDAVGQSWGHTYVRKFVRIARSALSGDHVQ